MHRREKYTEASDSYTQAGHQYKAARAYGKAGEAYSQAAQMYLNLSDDVSAGAMYKNAADMFKFVDPKKAGAVLETQCIPRLVSNGKFRQAAQMHQQLAQSLEKEENWEEAMSHFEKAMGYFEGDRSESSANQCKLKWAELAANAGKYQESAEAYEAVAAARADNSLLKFQAKEHLLDAGICYLALNDVVAAKQALDRFGDLDYTFAESREGRLFADLVESVEKGNAQGFVDALAEYDRISKLNPWRTRLLLLVRKGLSGAADGEIEAGTEDATATAEDELG